MTLQEIQTAVREGKTVHWKSNAYGVNLHTFKDGREQWLVVCAFNGDAIGLTRRDGVTLNGRPEDFFIAP